jgi:molybdenum cofactor biosynthesis enzyme MoaA
VGRRRLDLILDATNRCNLRCVIATSRAETRDAPRVEFTLSISRASSTKSCRT